MSFWEKFFSSSVFKKLRSFRKRFFVALLAIIIAFNTICKPKEVDAFAITTLLAIIGTVCTVTMTTIAAKDAYDRWKESSGETDDFETYFNKQITVDGNGNYVISDAGMVTINAMKKDIEEGDTYTYGYLPGSKNLNSESFNNKGGYDLCYQFIQSNPDYMFVIVTGQYIDGGPRGGTIYATPAPYAAVGMPNATVGTKCTYYDDNWSFLFKTKRIIFYDTGQWFYTDSSGSRVNFDGAEDVIGFDLSVVPTSSGNEFPSSNGTTFAARRPLASIKGGVGYDWIYCDHPGGFPVFNSVAAMKKGLEDCMKMEYMPGYTGGSITKNTVTQQEIEDYSTTYNYYYGDSSGGSGSGSGSGSGGGSSGNWVESIINGIGSFFDGLLTIVGKVIELLGKLVDLITKSFADLMDIVPTNFVNFLAALFPMVPEEWITAATLFITLALLGVLIRLFTK